ncbi:RNA polymerase III-inhibiting protein maf1 [Candidozyma auris]
MDLSKQFPEISLDLADVATELGINFLHNGKTAVDYLLQMPHKEKKSDDVTAFLLSLETKVHEMLKRVDELDKALDGGLRDETITEVFGFIDEVDLELVNQELNFSSLDDNLVIKGGCDLFTTKPIGSDRKLFKTIDKHLNQILKDNELCRSIDQERKQSLGSLFGSSASPPGNSSQYRSNRELYRRGSNASSLVSDGIDEFLGSPVSRRDTHNLSCSLDEVHFSDDSPFGSLKDVSTRKVFAYLIAILNTTYPDHDFSNLQPTTENFHRLTSIDDLKIRFNNVMMSLGKREETLSWIWDTVNVYMDIHLSSGTHPESHGHLRAKSLAPNSSLSTFDQQSDVDAGCKVYEFQPSDQSILEDLNYPYQTMWSNYWFIYNKKKKRVCFIYLTAINKLHYSKVQRAQSPFFNDSDSREVSSQKRSEAPYEDEFIEDGPNEFDDDFEEMDDSDVMGGMEM